MFSSAMRFSSHISQARPSSAASSCALAASTSGLITQPGSFARSRVQHCDSPRMRPSSSAFSQPSKTVTASIAVNLSFSSRARYLSKRYEASAQPSAAARERSASPAFGIVSESSAHPREAAARAAEKAATRTRSGVSLSSGPSPAMTAQRTVLSATGTTSSLPASPRKFSLTTTRRQKSRISPRSGSSETVSGSPSAASMAITASDSALKFSS